MLSSFYEAVLQKRISLYESGALKSFSLGAPTISIGNLTVGGTGKTPLVAFLAETLANAGEKVCIISRGYKRENPKKRILVSNAEMVLADARQAGDEPFELAQKLLGKAVVIADANRIRAANWARKTFGVTAFVLDDAFQHLRAKRDLDIVTIDATNPFGNGKLLPFGILREPLQNLKRADAIVITRANLAATIENLKAEIRKFNSVCPIFVSENRISKITKLEEFFAQTQKETDYELRITNYEKEKIQTPDDLKSKYLAFCGLGNPSNFFEQLRRENFDLRAVKTFPDHHFYRQSDITKLEKTARQTGAKILLTTAKDAVKLKDLKFDVPCLVIESEMVFPQRDEFCNLLISAMKAFRV